jgi:predicted Rossmann fold nucleotide-binding protein DprA/Smf involved in DNA uptake
MTVSNHTQAVLLLTAHFSKPGKDEIKPLGPKEWGRFALWLKERSLTPEQLVMGEPKTLLDGWNDKDITLERIEQLLSRSAALALAMEKWLRAGLWVITRSDPVYPIRIKQRLKQDSPPLLFGCGNPQLLNQGGLAVVGSRDADTDDLASSRSLGRLAAQQGYSIVSGGARGIDEAAMVGALDAEGTVIGVLADNLLSAAVSARYRRHLLNGNLVLVSPFYPEAGFSAGNAMARNKYIYCLADAAVVVHSGNKGGTWSGAHENLKKAWVPLWVKETDNPDAGNAQIVREGGRWIKTALDKLNLSELFDGPQKPIDTSLCGDSFDKFAKVSTDQKIADNNAPGTGQTMEQFDEGTIPAENRTATSALDKISAETNFYQFFLIKLKNLAQQEPKTADELARELDISKTQLNAWLKRAISEQKLRSFSKPRRYQWLAHNVEQTSLFDERRNVGSR